MLRKVLLSLALASAAFAAYIPKQDIQIKKDGLTKYQISGKNSWGVVDVRVEDEHLFQGFKARGKNGDYTVEMEAKSAGLAAGWKVEGKIGDNRVELSCKQDGAFSKSWTVKGKVGDRMIEAKADSEWDIDPAVQAIFIAFDCCDTKAPDEPKKDAPKK